MADLKDQTAQEEAQAMADVFRWEDDGGAVFPDDEKAALVPRADNTGEGCRPPQPDPTKP
jgi:hypothetical protein